MQIISNTNIVILLITKSSDKRNEQIKQSPENKDNNKPQF